MTSGLRLLQPVDVAQAVAKRLVPRIATALNDRAPGHCMRVFDLESGMSVTIARSLRKLSGSASVFVLSDGASAKNGDGIFVTSTKLVELRNPLPDGTLRPPLCVFVPSGMKTSAEDSFGPATFEDFGLGDVYGDLVHDTLTQVAPSLQSYIREVLRFLSEQQWRWATPYHQVRYLVAAFDNGLDAEALGTCLFELGLVPDFRVFNTPGGALGKVKRNLECVRVITESERTIRASVLDLDLANAGLRKRLSEHLLGHGNEDPIRWTREIVIDRKNWDLTFDKWEFASRSMPDQITIRSVVTDLPTVTDDETEEKLADLVGQQLLAPKNRKKLNVVLDVSPHPSQVTGLDHFTVQIISRTAGPIGVVKKVKAWSANRSTCTVSFTKLDKVDFDEGWHFVRVMPWTADSDPIPLKDPDSGKPGHESEPFYVLPEATLDEEPPQRAVPKADSVEHGRIDRQFTAIMQRRDPSGIRAESVNWGQKSSGKRVASQEILEAKFGAEGTMQIIVPRWLKIIEQRILASADQPASWRMQIHMGEPNTPTADICDLPASNTTRAYLDGRATYFAAIRQGQKELISQGADFLAARETAIAYASAYRDLIGDLVSRVERLSGADQQKALLALRTALAIDTIRIVLTDYRGRVREAAMVGPTHPLRALWQVGWAELASMWVAASRNAPEEFVTPTRRALTDGLTPLNFPSVLSLGDGRVFVSVDNIHPLWSLYSPATEEDPRGLLGEVCSAMGLSEPSIGGNLLTAEALASRLERYLVQHPYVRTLIINAFNPGRASLLAEALIKLQEREAFANLRYDVRLFVPDPEAPGVGDAINQLLAPDSSSATDVFSVPAKSHMFPKLTIAVRATKDFRSAPRQFRGHISLLFDVFPPEEVSTERPFAREVQSCLAGLVQDFVTLYRDDDAGTSWSRQARYGQIPASAEVPEATGLLCALPKLLAAATASVAQSAPAAESLPVITLDLDADQRALIYSVHDVSDWVFTIDRNMGIEFFDHGGRKDRPDYLIDFVPSSAPGQGHRLIISSRSIAELEAMVRPVLKQYGLDAVGKHAAKILDQLRALSGRIALKLVSSSTARAEVMGLALARLYLQYQGALRNQIVIPLDSHIDLFRTAKNRSDDIGDEITIRRTDLALFDLDLVNRTITCNLVEVKCYAQKLGFSGYAQLKDTITEQLNQSERVIQYHFDPRRTTPDRPDRALKTRELAVLLRFYLERSLRYGYLDKDAAAEAEVLLDSLESGYSLRFNRSGLVFDFEKPGTEAPESEVGIEFHRIGFDLIRVLIEGAAPGSSSSVDGGPQDGGPPLPLAPAAPIPPLSGLPQLQSAAFLAPDRPRSTSVGVLGEAGPPVPSKPSDETQPEVVNEGPVAEMTPEPTETAKEQALQKDELVVAPEQVPIHRHLAESDVPWDVLLGVAEDSPQYGLLGEVAARKVALDLNQTHTISLFGVQGGGKSYTLGTIIEMACMGIPHVSVLPRPLATILFHYSSTLDYKPEFTSMVQPNTNEAQVDMLRQRYGASPRGLSDIVILVPASKVVERREEYPGIEVVPIAFSARELKATHWKFLMGAVGSQSLYLRQVNLIMKKLREDLALDSILQAVEDSSLSDHLKDLARIRLKFAGEYVDDTRSLTGVVRPGRLVIVDLRDEFIEKDEALGLFVVLLQLFAEATYQGRSFNKLVVFDEAHKYIESQDLVTGLVEVVREMRHKGTSILVASQDPPSVPTALIELSSQVILHKFNSPAWLRHIQKANSALNNLTAEKLSSLGAGEAYLWSSKSTDTSFSNGAVRIRCRPRVTQHGGATKTAL